MALKLLKCFLKVADADGCVLGVVMIRRCYTCYKCDTKSKSNPHCNKRLKDKFKF